MTDFKLRSPVGGLANARSKAMVVLGLVVALVLLFFPAAVLLAAVVRH